MPFSSRGRVDELVAARWKAAGVAPTKLCPDAVFLRRAYLDVIGTLPTPEEAKSFLDDPSPEKREALVDRLLARPEFADYWAMKWSDLLRVKSEFPINLWPNAVQAYHRWIRASIQENRPYDRFVRELLTASGSNFRVPPVNFYRAVQSKDPQGLAKAVALTFMGVRTESWPEARLAGMAAFFSQVGFKATGEWKEEIVFFDPTKGTAALSAAAFPDGTKVRLAPGRDPRAVFADWLVDPRNPYFARSAVNRIWAWLLGRGIVHEPDDFRADNPAQNPELLAFLEQELVASHYDLKHVYRLILRSRAYQLSSLPVSASAVAEASFARYPIRRLDAEVLIDALGQVTGTSERYTSAIPEPFTFIPEDQRSIALADASTSSPFLEMFGRSPRDTGLETERDSRPTAAQRLHLLNSSHIQRKVEQGPRLVALAQSSPRPRELVDGLWLLVLSRYPTPEERKAVTEYMQSGLPRREALVDVAWALVNSAEFVYRH